MEKTAELCKKILRTQDIIGRYGGEEFVVLLAETDLEAAKIVAGRLRQAICDLTIPTRKGNVQLTISGGLAGDNVEEMNLIEMIESADKALYSAKEAGRNNIQVPSLEAKQ